MGPKIKRWSAAKKAEIVLALLRGTKQLVDICREGPFNNEVQQKDKN